MSGRPAEEQERKAGGLPLTVVMASPLDLTDHVQTCFDDRGC